MALNFYTSRDLRNLSGEMWQQLQEGKELVITSNGKPKAIMLDVGEDNLDDLLKAVRQAKATLAFSRMREIAAKDGFMDEADIEAEIRAARETGAASES